MFIETVIPYLMSPLQKMKTLIKCDSIHILHLFELAHGLHTHESQAQWHWTETAVKEETKETM